MQAAEVLHVLASRRTSSTVLESLSNGPWEFWGPNSTLPNPYIGVLALSDVLVVTPDSITMAREAMSAGPRLGTFVMLPEVTKGKFKRFFDEYLHAPKVLSRGRDSWKVVDSVAETTNAGSNFEEQLSQFSGVQRMHQKEEGDSDMEGLELY